jgi:hypothetical protein
MNYKIIRGYINIPLRIIRYFKNKIFCISIILPFTGFWVKFFVTVQVNFKGIGWPVKTA